MKRNLFALLFVVVCSLSAFALTGAVKDIRVEYNVVLNNQKSIKVHIDYDLKGTAGEKYYITLWFKDSNGNFKYISGDAKSSDKGIGYYVGRYSYSSPGTYSIWFAPALHRLSLKPGERNFQAMAVVYDSNMKQLGAKTINVNLPDSPNYPQKTPVINTPPDKADYKIAATPVSQSTVPQQQNRSVAPVNNSTANYALANSYFIEEGVWKMSAKTKQKVSGDISGVIYTFNPANSSLTPQFGIVLTTKLSFSDYLDVDKDYRKAVNSGNILSIAFKKGACYELHKKTNGAKVTEFYYLATSQSATTGWCLEFNIFDECAFLYKWTLDSDGSHYIKDKDFYYALTVNDEEDYHAVYSAFKFALNSGIFKKI